MAGSAVFYIGLMIAACGALLLVKPARRLRVPTRRRALAVLGAGVVLSAAGLGLPAGESGVNRPATRLDEFAPVWQFREFHSIRIAAPPERVFEAIESVRADEILLFRALTWLRRGGRPLPDTILDPGADEPLIDVAVRGGFVRLARDHPREIVIGTAVLAPPGVQVGLTPESFTTPQAPGFALASMNFLVEPDGEGGSTVSTETRVYANTPAARRRFAAYWRVIYPGSALIRRMWLRAVRIRAEDPSMSATRPNRTALGIVIQDG